MTHQEHTEAKEKAKSDRTVTRAVGILAVMLTGMMAAMSEGAPPTEKERNDATIKLNKAADALNTRGAEVGKIAEKRAEIKLKLENMDKSIKAFAKVLADNKDTSEESRGILTLMQQKLEELTVTQSKAEADFLKGNIDIKKLQDTYKLSLEAFFDKAPPDVLARAFDLDWDGFKFSGTPEFVKRTDGASAEQPYALDAEHRWVDKFTYIDGGEQKQIAMQEIGQHEQITALDTKLMATRLLTKAIPGIDPKVARVGMMANRDHSIPYREATRRIFGNAEPPTVLNNSTGGGMDPIDDRAAYNADMQFYNRDGAKTYKVDGAIVTYGIPNHAKPIVSNSAGNSGFFTQPDLSINLFNRNRLFIGVSAFPAQKGTNRREFGKPSELEEYSSGGVVDYVVQRPRFNPDGTPIVHQYLSKVLKTTVENNVWKLVGGTSKDEFLKEACKNGRPTDEQLVQIEIDHPGLYDRLQKDLTNFITALQRGHGCDENGLNYNLRGTSFSAPTNAGIILAAKTLFPDASQEEIQAAAMAACVPLVHRQLHDLSAATDIMYQVDKKSGWRFAWKGAGHGEFEIRDDATEAKPDSWIKMQQFLVKMQDAQDSYTDGRRSKS